MRFVVGWLLLALISGAPSHLTAEEKLDECPAGFDAPHPACPPLATLGWVDCPPRWPRDPSKLLRYGEPLAAYQWTTPILDRSYLDSLGKYGAQLLCKYGTEKEVRLYQLYLDVDAPISQWGFHDVPGGRTAGVLVPKALAAKPREIHLIEPATRSLELKGFRLGMTLPQIEKRAAKTGFTIAEAGMARVRLNRGEERLEIAFNKAGKAWEIVQELEPLSYQEWKKALVKRFGFDRTLSESSANGARFKDTNLIVWHFAHPSVELEFWSMKATGGPPALHLIDTAARPK